MGVGKNYSHQNLGKLAQGNVQWQPPKQWVLKSEPSISMHLRALAEDLLA